MRKRTLGVVLLAGLAISGGSAFTGSNTFSGGSDTRTAGYGAVTATGITISDTKYNLSTTDASKLASVDFTTSTDVTTGYSMKMTLRSGSTVVDTSTCTAAALVTVPVTYKISCDNADTTVSSFDSVGLTVVTA